MIMMMMMMMMIIIIIILIDVAIPAEGNAVYKETEKELNYKSLCIETQRMWNPGSDVFDTLKTDHYL
jgi:hypothetical protein